MRQSGRRRLTTHPADPLPCGQPAMALPCGVGNRVLGFGVHRKSDAFPQGPPVRRQAVFRAERATEVGWVHITAARSVAG